MSPPLDMRAASAALAIVTYLHQETVDTKFAKMLILETVSETGPIETIVGLTNIIRLLLYLRSEEVGVQSNQTLEKLALILAKVDSDEP